MDIGTNPYDVAAIVFAPAAALASLRLTNYWRLALVLIVACVGGWVLMFASEAWADSQLAAMVNAIPSPSTQQMEQFSADGGSKTALLLLGLPLSALYALVWFTVVRGAGVVVRSLLRAR